MVFDDTNQVWVIHGNLDNKIYVFTREGERKKEFDLASKPYWNSNVYTSGGLVYGENGITYGVARDAVLSEVKIYRIYNVPPEDISYVGQFDNGLDAIFTTEDDECITFEVCRKSTDTANQLLLTCKNE